MSYYLQESNVNVRYAAPEVIKRMSNSRRVEPSLLADQASDMYSLGVVMLEVLSGNPPWGFMPDSDVKDAVASGMTLEVPSDVNDVLSIAVATIIEECINVDSASRPIVSVVNSRLLGLAP